MKGHKTVFILIGVEQGQLLTAMDVTGRGIHIQHDGLRSPIKRSNELIHQCIAHPEQFFGRHPVLQPAHRRLGRQRIFFRQTACCYFKKRIVAQVIAVVGIFLPAADLGNALCEQLFGRVINV